LLAVIGKGSYGQVFRVLDHKTNEEGALKVIKNEPKFSKQAFIEIKILSHVKERDR
jgi:dual specificity tyrosine-phosphorylation-regulated kinase 2/3/4